MTRMADIIDQNKVVDSLQSRLNACSTAKVEEVARIAAEPGEHYFLSRLIMSKEIAEQQKQDRITADKDEKDCVAASVRDAKEMLGAQKQYDAAMAGAVNTITRNQARTIENQNKALKEATVANRIIATERDILYQTLDGLLSTIPAPRNPEFKKNTGQLLAAHSPQKR